MPDNFEIVFSYDTTGSMYSCLKEVRNKLGETVRDLKSKIPGIKIAIFAHGDYCDAGSSYVTKYINFTNDANSLCNFVIDVGATGGGDEPECYELVMREVQEKLSWSSNSQNALVFIGDAPPHEASESQNYRHLDWKDELVRLRDMGGGTASSSTSYTSMTGTVTPSEPTPSSFTPHSTKPSLDYDDDDDDEDDDDIYDVGMYDRGWQS